MEVAVVDQANELLEKANANLEPELLGAADARELLESYARTQRLAAFGIAALARKLDDASEIARATGSSTGKAKETIATGKVLSGSAPLENALKHGEVSLDQAAEIARAEESAPGSAGELLKVAEAESFHVLRERARKTKLEAEQHKGLAERQHAARSARSYGDMLGMVHIHMELEPHVGTPIVARAEAEAQRLARKARADKGKTAKEPFECYLADAYAALLSGSGKGRAKRPELVVLVSHEVAKRGWTDVKEGEVCKIPGMGPVAPQVAKKIARDAFLNGVFFDGVDLRNFKRWSRDPSVEVRTALELGEPTEFDGVLCVDCGNRLRPEFDHVEPRVALGPTSHRNLKPRCYGCHQAKTERDRKAGKLKPPEP
ncbi:MAG: HNH endonuclease [Actinomycetota bacterium]